MSGGQPDRRLRAGCGARPARRVRSARRLERAIAHSEPLNASPGLTGGDLRIVPVLRATVEASTRAKSRRSAAWPRLRVRNYPRFSPK
jgi:hypothetical protein